MRFLFPRRPQDSSKRRPLRRPQRAPVNHRVLYDECVMAAHDEQTRRLDELSVMRESLDLFGPFMLQLIDHRLVLCPEALGWSEAEQAITIDLTRLIWDPAANGRLIGTLLDAGLEITARTQVGPWYSVRMEYEALAVCVQGLWVDTTVSDEQEVRGA